MKKNFFIKLNAYALGVRSGTLDDSCPLRPLTLDGTVEDQYSCTEVFGDEIGFAVTAKSLYRETQYSVCIPYESDIYDRTVDFMSGSDGSVENPWLYLHQSILVSN